jgi:hypothetical protein
MGSLAKRGMGYQPMFEVLLDFDRYSDRIKQERSDLRSCAELHLFRPMKIAALLLLVRNTGQIAKYRNHGLVAHATSCVFSICSTSSAP